MGIRKTIHIADIAVPVAVLILVSLVANIRPCTCTVIERVDSKQQQQQHVVGGDEGWDASTDLASWSTANNNKFHVGDTIWFTYAAPEEGVIELKSKGEFEACKASNPIKMYTQGLDQVALQSEGSRYFISANPENCNKGLKLHVKVLPLPLPSYSVHQVLAEAPSTSATKCYQGSMLLFSLVCFALAFLLFSF